MAIGSVESGNESVREALRDQLEGMLKHYGVGPDEIIKIAQDIASGNKIESSNRERLEIQNDPILRVLDERIRDLEFVRVPLGQSGGRFAGVLSEEASAERDVAISRYCQKYGITIPKSWEEKIRMLDNIETQREIGNGLLESLKENPELRNLLKEGSVVKVRRSSGEIDTGWQVTNFNGIYVTVQKRVNDKDVLRKVIPASRILDLNQ